MAANALQFTFLRRRNGRLGVPTNTRACMGVPLFRQVGALTASVKYLQCLFRVPHRWRLLNHNYQCDDLVLSPSVTCSHVNARGT